MASRVVPVTAAIEIKILIIVKSTLVVFLAGVVSCLVGCKNNRIEVPLSPYPISYDSFSMDTIAQGFTIPYGLAIVGEDEFFVTDRVGKMFHLHGDKRVEITGMPDVVTFTTPGIPAMLLGGLMDLSIHPDYSTN